MNLSNNEKKMKNEISRYFLFIIRELLFSMSEAGFVFLFPQRVAY